MKILIFMTQFYQLGGAEKLAVELAEELNARNIDTDILSIYSNNISGTKEQIDRLHKKGIRNINSLGLCVHPSIFSLLSSILKLRKLLKTQNYDIIETSSMIPTLVASWATLGTHVKHIAGLHQVFRKDRENSFKHKLWQISTMLNKHVNYYAISDYVASKWISYSHVPSERVFKVYNAIANKFFEAEADKDTVHREFNIPENGIIAIYVGRLAAYKGIDTILEALSPVLKHQNIFLLYVGLPDYDVAGTKEMISRMKNKISLEKLESNVKIIGFREDIPRLMAAADVLVHPTKIEGFGLTLVEAMAVGLPVVASNVEAIPEILTGTDSLMVTPNNPEALLEAVLSTLKRTPINKKMAIDKGKNRAKDFSINRRASEMINLFQTLFQCCGNNFKSNKEIIL